MIRTIRRKRTLYGILIMFVIILGVASRRFDDYLPNFFGSYPGDVLWALMGFLVIGFLHSTLSTSRAALAAGIFSFSIELSQLYHAPWIDGIRQTIIGGLILGYAFVWTDLICYITGIIIGILVEKFFLYRYNKAGFFYGRR